MFHVMIGCIHEIALTKTQTLPDGRMKQRDSSGVSEIEYQLLTLPRFTSLLHRYDDTLVCYSNKNSKSRHYCANNVSY